MTLPMDFGVETILDPHFNNIFNTDEYFLPKKEFFSSCGYNTLLDDVGACYSESSRDLWKEDGSSDSGIDCIQTKAEPLSPTFFSDSPTDFTSSPKIVEGLDCMLGDHFYTDGYMNGSCFQVDQTILDDEEVDDLLSQISSESSATASVATSAVLTEEIVSDIYSFEDNFLSPSDVTMTSTPALGSHSINGDLFHSRNNSPQKKQKENVSIQLSPGSLHQQSSSAPTIIVIQPSSAAKNCKRIQIQPRPVGEVPLANCSIAYSVNATTTRNVVAPAFNTTAITTSMKQPPLSTSSSIVNTTSQKINFFLPSSTTSTLNTFVTSSVNDYAGSLIDCGGSKAVKRQQRMIKNRESASLSRKRKKEYLECLESKLKCVTDENMILKMENSALKNKLSSLQSENEYLRNNKKINLKSGMLLTVCFLCIFNFGSFVYNMNIPLLDGSRSNLMENIFSLPNSLPQPSLSLKKGGRTLKQLDSSYINQSSAEDRLLNFRKTDNGSKVSGRYLNNREEFIVSQKDDGMAAAKCPTTFVNSSETIRLMNELRGWADSHEVELKKRMEKKKSRKNKGEKEHTNITSINDTYQSDLNLKLTYSGPVMTNKKNLFSGLKFLKHHEHDSSEVFERQRQKKKKENNSERMSRYEMQVYGRSRNQNGFNYEEFFSAIRRRNDTFYIVSFHNDHLLLPATAHNKSTRPRMSVFMPAVGVNSPVHHSLDHFSMMQIDCEVTATRLIHLDRSSIPNYLLNSFYHNGTRTDDAQEEMTGYDDINDGENVKRADASVLFHERQQAFVNGHQGSSHLKNEAHSNKPSGRFQDRHRRDGDGSNCKNGTHKHEE